MGVCSGVHAGVCSGVYVGVMVYMWVGCVTDFQVLQVNRLFAITYSVDYAFSRIAGYRFQNFLQSK